LLFGRYDGHDVSDEQSPAALAGSDDERPADGSSPTLDALDGSVSHRSGAASGAPGPLPGSIGRFQISRLLGIGGMGVVYLAEDPALGRKVAIKLLHADRAHHANAQARLQREARALASLSHPHVVVVHEVGMHEGQVYLVMEHVAGPTLREWTLARPSEWQAILGQYRAAGEGLAAAHRAGIIHRDFKPDNVLVDEDGRARVLDFGLASPGAEPPSKDVSWDERGPVDLTKTGAVLGTPAYMAPEQFLKATVDARTDQFSFCIALWEALFGQRPFEGDELLQLCSRVIAGQLRKPPPRTRVPASIVAALQRGLCADPTRRFASMPELLAALAEPRGGRTARIAVGSAAVLAGLAVTAWLVREPATVETPSAPASPVVMAPGSPPSAPPEPELPMLTSRQLTHTAGFGVEWVSAIPDQRAVLYSTKGDDDDDTGWWRLPLEPAAARPTVLPVEDHDGVVHAARDGAYWIVTDEAIQRVGPDGSVERTIELGDVHPDARGRRGWLSPDERSLAIANESGFEVWDLTGTEPGPVRVRLGSPSLGLAWAPDSTRIAAVVNLGSSHRVDVFDLDGSLQLSTPWPAIAMGGQPLPGLVWGPAGLVVLVFDESEAWVQCATLTETGIVPGRRSAGMATSPHTELVDVVDGHTLLAVWPDVRGHLLVMDLLDERARLHGPLHEVRSNHGAPVWLSDTEVAFLAAAPAGALMKLHVDAPEAPEPLAPGPFEWAGSDGEGGIVLGSADGKILYWPNGIASPRPLRLPGVGPGDPLLRCRTPHDCLMSTNSAARSGADDSFLAIDLEREHVERRFACPTGALCRARWGRAHDGRVLMVGHEQRELLRFDAETGERLGAPQPAPPWAVVQSATETSRGELLVTGMLVDEPPPGIPKHVYMLIRREDDGSWRHLWSNDTTWVVRPRASPSGRRLTLEGLTFRSELVALELGSLCEGPL